MRSTSERIAALIDTVQLESRRGLLINGVKIAAGGGLALATVAHLQSSASTQETTPADDTPFAGPVDVLQYALALEHLESALYREALETFDPQAFIDTGFQVSVREYIEAVAEHEASHVETLTGVISDLGEDRSRKPLMTSATPISPASSPPPPQLRTWASTPPPAPPNT